MRCEVCGRKIRSEPICAVIEGARLTVCAECSKHGRVIVNEETVTPQPSVTKSNAHIPVIMKKPPAPQVQLSQELVEGYANKIRSAREKNGLSHEDLGKKINEKASLLRHIETGKVAPTNQLAGKLEHTLRIKLLVPVEDEKVTAPIPKAASTGLTLGDLIDMGKKDRGVSSKRKQS